MGNLENDDQRPGIPDSRLDFTPDTTGQYYLHVKSADSGNAHGVGTYTVALTDLTPAETKEAPQTPGQGNRQVGDDDCADDSGTTCTVEVGDTGEDGEIEAAEDADWFKVLLYRNQIYTLTVDGDLSGRRVGRVLSAWDGREQDVLNEKTADFNPQLQVKIDEYDQEDKVYTDGVPYLPFYVEVKSNSDTATGTYTLKVTKKADDCSVDKDSECHLKGWAGGVIDRTWNATIEHADDVDWIRVSVHHGTTASPFEQAEGYLYRIYVYGAYTNFGDFTLQDAQILGVYDPDNNLVPFTRRTDQQAAYLPSEIGPQNRAPEIIFHAGKPGVYKFAVASELNYIGTYGLNVIITKPAFFPDAEPNSKGSRVPEITVTDGKGSKQGTIELTTGGTTLASMPDLDIDWFKVTLEKDKPYWVDVRGYFWDHYETGCSLQGVWVDDPPENECELTLAQPRLRGILNSSMVLQPGTTTTPRCGAGPCDARVQFTPPNAGTYYIVVDTITPWPMPEDRRFWTALMYGTYEVVVERTVATSLSDLKLSGFRLNRPFSPLKHSYTATAEEGNTSCLTTVTATSALSGSTVAITPAEPSGNTTPGHQVSLDSATTITVTVTSQNSEEGAYKVRISGQPGCS